MRTPRTQLEICPGISIPLSEFEVRAIRAAGPGGQHVNKTSTAIQLRFDIAASASLSAAIKQRLRRLAGNRVSRDGELVITAQRFRSQNRNYQDALDRVQKMVRRAAQPPPQRKRTRPPEASRRRRLEDKQRRSRLKQQRAKPGRYD